jgi:hypothetical protein
MTSAARKIDHHQAAICETPVIEIFRERCEARAQLVAHGLHSLQDSVDTLQLAAERQGLVQQYGQDEVQRILAEAFAKVDKPGRKIIVSTLARPFTKLTELERLAILRQCHDLEQRTRAPIDEPRPPCRTAASTINAFWYVVGLRDQGRFKAWLADHPQDAPFLLKLMEGK